MVVLNAARSHETIELVPPFKEVDWEFFGDVFPGKDVLQFGKQSGQPGAVWSKLPLDSDDWELNATIRVFADETVKPGRSGLAIWYTSEVLPTGPVHGSQDAWDGLSLMLDSLGWSEDGLNLGSLGALRGHMNDGQSRFNTIENSAQDAFGLCRINYRAMHGAAIDLAVTYADGDFEVAVNGQTCFKSNKIALPTGYYVGFSADTDGSTDTFVLDSAHLSQKLTDYAADSHITSPRKLHEELSRRPAEHDAAREGVAAAAAEVTTAAAPFKDFTNDIKSMRALIHTLEESERDLTIRVKDLETLVVHFNEEMQKAQVQLMSQATSLQQAGRNMADFANRIHNIDDVVKNTDGLREALDFSADIEELRSQISAISRDFEGHQGLFQTVSDRANSASQHGIVSLLLTILCTNFVLFLLYSAYRSRRPKHYKIV